MNDCDWQHDLAISMASRIAAIDTSSSDVADYIQGELSKLWRDRSKDFIVYMLLWCPECGERHIDEGEFETKTHHTHACQHCGHCWRPAVGATCGVRFLPGFKNE